MKLTDRQIIAIYLFLFQFSEAPSEGLTPEEHAKVIAECDTLLIANEMPKDEDTIYDEDGGPCNTPVYDLWNETYMPEDMDEEEFPFEDMEPFLDNPKDITAESLYNYLIKNF